MARITGSVLGNLSGKLGNLSARTRNGKTYLAARPGSFIVSQSAGSVEARQKFAVVVALAKIIGGLASLKSIWDKVKNPGASVFNTIFRQNYDLASVDRPTDQNIITPGGFDISMQNPVVAANSITGDIDALNTKAVFSANEVDLDIVAVVCYYNPVDPADAPYKLINLSKAEAGFDFANPYALNIAYNVNQQIVAAKYQNSIVFLAVASKDADGNIVQYSATLTIAN